MDRLTIGVCILDPAGNVAVCNEKFKRQQEVYRVFCISTSGSLKFFLPNDQHRLNAIKADIFNHGQFGARARKEAIAEGLTNAQIAERRGRSVATINAQLKSILSKSHCSTRTQFVRLVMIFGANYVVSGR